MDMFHEWKFSTQFKRFLLRRRLPNSNDFVVQFRSYTVTGYFFALEGKYKDQRGWRVGISQRSHPLTGDHTSSSGTAHLQRLIHSPKENCNKMMASTIKHHSLHIFQNTFQHIIFTDIFSHILSHLTLLHLFNTWLPIVGQGNNWFVRSQMSPKWPAKASNPSVLSLNPISLFYPAPEEAHVAD